MKLKYVLIVCVMPLLQYGFGQMDTTMVIEPIQADRPDQTETAFLVPKGYFQMEHGFSIEQAKPGFLYSYPSSLWKFGVNENFELRLMTQYIRIQREPNPDQVGFLPMAIGFKSKLTEQRGIFPKMSFIGHLTFPGVVSEDFETTYFAPDLKLAFFHGVSDFFSLGYNLGVNWNGEDGEPNFIYTFAPSIALTSRLGMYGEIYGSTPQREAGPIEFRAAGGFTYLIGNDLLLDVSGGQGITDNAPERYIAVGFSYRFKM